MTRKVINLAVERQRRVTAGDRATEDDAEGDVEFAAETAVEAGLTRSRFMRLCALFYDKFKRKLSK